MAKRKLDKFDIEAMKEARAIKHSNFRVGAMARDTQKIKSNHYYTRNNKPDTITPKPKLNKNSNIKYFCNDLPKHGVNIDIHNRIEQQAEEQKLLRRVNRAIKNNEKIICIS